MNKDKPLEDRETPEEKALFAKIGHYDQVPSPAPTFSKAELLALVRYWENRARRDLFDEWLYQQSFDAWDMVRARNRHLELIEAVIGCDAVQAAVDRAFNEFDFDQRHLDGDGPALWRCYLVECNPEKFGPASPEELAALAHHREDLERHHRGIEQEAMEEIPSELPSLAPTPTEDPRRVPGEPGAAGPAVRRAADADAGGDRARHARPAGASDHAPKEDGPLPVLPGDRQPAEQHLQRLHPKEHRDQEVPAGGGIKNPTKEDNEPLATTYGLRVDVHGADLHFAEIETGETIVHSVGPLTESDVKRVLHHIWHTRRVASLGVEWDVTAAERVDGGQIPLRVGERYGESDMAKDIRSFSRRPRPLPV